MVASNPKSDAALVEPNAIEEILDGDNATEAEPTLPPHVASFLGEQLQALYSHLMSEPVPDRFVQLLAQLDQEGTQPDGE
ncbi:NepR family anti-sigma factor [Microvirga sesbaniae]|uniref:NepR family anti-sigma factor n=1 Tax=Microvirga sesbaniae TaxID=681392 RepID=UPI0021C8F34C|nr:NepR family anti-sigma factor [Microvirga sp. HBU67692]